MLREPTAELLAVVLDARVALLCEAPQPQQPAQAQECSAAAGLPVLPCLWDALLVLFRAHAAMCSEQRAVIVGANARRAAVLAGGQCNAIDWSAARAAVAAFVLEDGASGAPAVSVALSRALCFASRVRHDTDNPDFPARVLLVDGSATSADLAAQGTTLTGCAFAAKNAGVPVDCLSLGPEPSALLRQVSILTAGKHHALSCSSSRPHSLSEVLVPALLFHFLPGIAVRKELNATEDFHHLAAVCSCHGKAVDVAHVCSCCLAVYCTGAPAICPACRTRFWQDQSTDPRLLDLDLAGEAREAAARGR